LRGPKDRNDHAALQAYSIIINIRNPDLTGRGYYITALRASTQVRWGPPFPNRMNFFFLLALLAAVLPVSAQAQQSETTSVCLRDTPPGLLLNICGHERGMAPTPQPRLYLRIYKDGRGEYEASKSWNTLVKKNFNINDEDLRELNSLSAAASLETTIERYPAYHHGIDSSRELTVDIHADGAQKRIILTNFFATDRENKKHYPASLISLMEKVEEIWARANGIVTDPPGITFCTLMSDREYLTVKLVRIWADMELGVEEGSYLHEPGCDRPETGKARTNERIGFGYDEKRLGKGANIRDILQQKGFHTDTPRVRVLVEGRLREETTGQYHPREPMNPAPPPDRTKDNYPYVFIIERFLSIDQIAVPYAGELKPSWTYTDTIDHVRGKPLKLSSPLKPIIHHAQLIEWTNEDKFPALRRSGRKYLTFRVLSKETRQMERWRWDDVYMCELIRVSEGGKQKAVRTGVAILPFAFYSVRRHLLPAPAISQEVSWLSKD
jgi:hypothetical protein